MLAVYVRRHLWLGGGSVLLMICQSESLVSQRGPSHMKPQEFYDEILHSVGFNVWSSEGRTYLLHFACFCKI